MSAYATKTYVDEEIAILNDKLENNLKASYIEGTTKSFDYCNTPNASKKLNIKTHESGEDQPIHPKVLFFKNGFGGHKYWMAYTPYPNARDAEENPCVAYSDDMINWHEPINGLNPLDIGTSSEYMSDTHLVYNYDTEKLELWYRQASTINNTETIYRRTTTDGLAWSDREEMYRSTGGISKVLSPCINYEDGIYKIWAGSGNPSGYLKYYESTDGCNWEYKATTNLMGWHFDIIKTELGYESIISDTQSGATISYAKSTDGISWSEKKLLLSKGESGNFDDTRLYRASVLKLDDIYCVYYTGVSSSNVWGIGLSVSTNKNDIFSIKGVNDISDTVIKYTANDLYRIINDLYSRISALEGEAGIVDVTSISLNKSTHSMQIGDTLQLIESVLPSNATNREVVWECSNSNASVVNGLVTANQSGECTIICKLKSNNSVFATCSIYIEPKTESDSVNVLNVEWIDGYVNGSTGIYGSSTQDRCSDFIEINNYKFACCNFINGHNTYNRIVFYDSNKEFIESINSTNRISMGEIAENAKYFRISYNKANLTSIELYLGNENSFTGLNNKPNQYYDVSSGALKNETGLSASDFIDLRGFDACCIEGVLSGVLWDSEKRYLSGIAYDQNAPMRKIDISNQSYMTINYKTTNANVKCFGVNKKGEYII